MSTEQDAMKTKKQIEELRRDCVAQLRELLDMFRRAGVPEPFVHELLILQIYRVDHKLAKSFEKWRDR